MGSEEFKSTQNIDGVSIRSLTRYEDSRGWLLELFRDDEVDNIYHPVMGYVSLTRSNVARGPHEHSEQTDYFVFPGIGKFMLVLWDNRIDRHSYNHRAVYVVGGSNPCSVIIPPKVVHAYRCISDDAGIVINIPNRLYKGEGRVECVDEIRHEDDSESPYVIDLSKVVEEHSK